MELGEVDRHCTCSKWRMAINTESGSEESGPLLFSAFRTWWTVPAQIGGGRDGERFGQGKKRPRIEGYPGPGFLEFKSRSSEPRCLRKGKYSTGCKEGNENFSDTGKEAVEKWPSLSVREGEVS